MQAALCLVMSGQAAGRGCRDWVEIDSVHVQTVQTHNKHTHKRALPTLTNDQAGCQKRKEKRAHDLRKNREKNGRETGRVTPFLHHTGHCCKYMYSQRSSIYSLQSLSHTTVCKHFNKHSPKCWAAWANAHAPKTVSEKTRVLISILGKITLILFWGNNPNRVNLWSQSRKKKVEGLDFL